MGGCSVEPGKVVRGYDREKGREGGKKGGEKGKTVEHLSEK